MALGRQMTPNLAFNRTPGRVSSVFRASGAGRRLT